MSKDFDPTVVAETLTRFFVEGLKGLQALNDAKPVLQDLSRLELVLSKAIELSKTDWVEPKTAADSTIVRLIDKSVVKSNLSYFTAGLYCIDFSTYSSIVFDADKNHIQWAIDAKKKMFNRRFFDFKTEGFIVRKDGPLNFFIVEDTSNIKDLFPREVGSVGEVPYYRLHALAFAYNFVWKYPDKTVHVYVGNDDALKLVLLMHHPRILPVDVRK